MTVYGGKYGKAFEKKYGHPLVANLPLGFWTNFFRQGQYVILGDDLLTIFPGLPLDKNTRQIVNKQLFNIRLTRNRIAHDEQIIFVDGRLDFNRADKCVENIINLTLSLEVDTSIYRQNLDLAKKYQEEIMVLTNRNPAFSAG